MTSDLELGRLKETSDELKALEKEGRADDVIARRGELIGDLDRAGEAGEQLLLKNLVRHAVMLQRAGQPSSAIATISRAADLARTVSLAGRAHFDAEVLFLQARYSLEAGRFDEAIRAADAVATKYMERPEVGEWVAGVLLMKSQCFGSSRLNKPDAELIVLKTIVRRFQDSQDPRVERYVAAALDRQAELLRERGDLEGAATLWGQVFHQFSGKPPLKISWVPFQAQAQRVQTLIAAGELTAAAEAGQEFVAFCQNLDTRDDAPTASIGRALIRAGQALDRGGELRGALALFDEAETLLSPPQASDRDTQALDVYAMINSSAVLGRLGDVEAGLRKMEAVVNAGEPALVALESIVEDARRQPPAVGRDREPWALLTKGLVLQQLRRVDEARQALTEVTATVSENPSPMATMLRAAAYHALAEHEQ